MVKRNRTEIARSTPEKQLSETASARSNIKISPNTADDVIGTLANAYENKRARQVVEWERAQPQYLRRSA